MDDIEDKGQRLVSRRAIIAGSVGTVGGLLAAEALAQSGAGQLRPAAHTMHGGTLGDRIYSLNPAHPESADIAENPENVPPPVNRSEPANVRVDLETIEVEATLDATSRFRFWTFNGKVPGPFIRVRVGDTVEVHLKNNENSWMFHNVDFHAAT